MLCKIIIYIDIWLIEKLGIWDSVTGCNLSAKMFNFWQCAVKMHLDYIETMQSYCLLSICSASKWDNILQNVIIFEPCWTLLQVSLVSATPSEVITTESLTPGLGARRDKWGCIYSTRPARYSSWRERGKSGALTSHPASSCHLTCVYSQYLYRTCSLVALTFWIRSRQDKGADLLEQGLPDIPHGGREANQERWHRVRPVVVTLSCI